MRNASAPEIKKVDRNTELAEQLICFVENFSWEEVKEHTLRILLNMRKQSALTRSTFRRNMWDYTRSTDTVILRIS